MSQYPKESQSRNEEGPLDSTERQIMSNPSRPYMHPHSTRLIARGNLSNVNTRSRQDAALLDEKSDSCLTTAEPTPDSSSDELGRLYSNTISYPSSHSNSQSSSNTAPTSVYALQRPDRSDRVETIQTKPQDSTFTIRHLPINTREISVFHLPTTLFEPRTSAIEVDIAPEFRSDNDGMIEGDMEELQDPVYLDQSRYRHFLREPRHRSKFDEARGKSTFASGTTTSGPERRNNARRGSLGSSYGGQYRAQRTNTQFNLQLVSTDSRPRGTDCMTGLQAAGEIKSNSCRNLLPQESQNPVQRPGDSAIRISNTGIENNNISFNEHSSSQLYSNNEYEDTDSDSDLFKVPEDIGERIAPFLRQNELRKYQLDPYSTYLQRANRNWNMDAPGKDELTLRALDKRIKGMASIELQNPYTPDRKSLFVRLPTVGDFLKQKQTKPRSMQEEWVRRKGKELLRLEQQDSYITRVTAPSPASINPVTLRNMPLPVPQKEPSCIIFIDSSDSSKELHA